MTSVICRAESQEGKVIEAAAANVAKTDVNNQQAQATQQETSQLSNKNLKEEMKIRLLSAHTTHTDIMILDELLLYPVGWKKDKEIF